MESSGQPSKSQANINHLKKHLWGFGEKKQIKDKTKTTDDMEGMNNTFKHYSSNLKAGVQLKTF